MEIRRRRSLNELGSRKHLPVLNKYVAGFFSGVLGDKDKKKSDLLESPSKEAEAE